MLVPLLVLLSQPTINAQACHYTCCCFPAVPHWLAVPLRWCRAVLDHPAVNVPLGATVLGIACAAVGPVRGLLVDELAPLHWLWLSLSWVGAAAAPLATMQIGEGF
jgi:hypothetical protein